MVSVFCAVNEVHLSCAEGGGDVVGMQACLTIGTAPFDTLRGSYKTLEFYFHIRCEGTHTPPYILSMVNTILQSRLLVCVM